MTQVYLPERPPAALHPAPLHRGVVSFGACLLIETFVSDLAYWKTTLFQWNNFSMWLLLGGLILAGFAALALVVDLALGRVRRLSWPRFTGVALAALLSLLNAFVHSRDAYTAVVPEGITLSAIVTVILILVGATGGWDLSARVGRPAQVGSVRA